MSSNTKRIYNYPTNRADIKGWSDKYFSRTADIVRHNGECEVTYATFIRRPCIMACGAVMEWLQGLGVNAAAAAPEGAPVGAGDPLFYITGPFSQTAELETLWLQKTGLSCMVAHNAYEMAMALPDTRFLAMDARHCAGLEMAELSAYGASVGSASAKAQGAMGFVGNATDRTAHFFGNEAGLGTIPHALIGYAGSTLKAAQMFHETHPNAPLIVLVDYFGAELDDTLSVCDAFQDLAKKGQLSIRLDTHGGRYMQGLDPQSSYAVLEAHVPEVIRSHQSTQERNHLIGTGVSAAAVWSMRDHLNRHGFERVGIVASSGFTVEKCALFAKAKAPVDMIGTGSALPNRWAESYATSDIIAYDGTYRVKQGREHLIKAHQDWSADS